MVRSLIVFSMYFPQNMRSFAIKPWSNGLEPFKRSSQKSFIGDPSCWNMLALFECENVFT